METFVLIGNGFIAPRHIDSIKHVGGELLAICDIDKTKKIEGVPFLTDYRALPAEPFWARTKNVVICTPNDLHVPMATWAMQQGKRVLCEKPIGLDAGELVKFAGAQSIFAVMQLRHHPVMAELRAITQVESASLYVKVKRGNDYWTGWKGDESRSGGILFNLGVHYFDVLTQLLGNECFNIEKTEETRKKVVGQMWFYGVPAPVKFHVEICSDGEGQDRYLEVNGTRYRFSDKDNLSFEDLHKKVYEEFVEGRGVGIRGLVDLTRFIERIKRHHV